MAASEQLVRAGGRDETWLLTGFGRDAQTEGQLKESRESNDQLRDELESSRFEFESKLQKNISEKVDEHSHLIETITILRA